MSAVVSSVVALLGLIATGQVEADSDPAQHLQLCPQDLLRQGGWKAYWVDEASLSRPSEPARDGGPAVGPAFRLDQMPAGVPDVAWFRARVRVPEALRGRPLGVFVAHVGAFEVYVDGERVGGEDFPLPSDPGEMRVSSGHLAGVFTSTSSDPLLAVRVVTALGHVGALMGNWRGAAVQVCPPRVGLAAIASELDWLRVIYACFIGFTLALAVLHLSLHLNVAEDRAGHLDYAVFTLATAGLSTAILARSFNGTLAEATAFSRVFVLSLVILTLFGTRFFAGSALGAASQVRRWALLVLVPSLVVFSIWPQVPAAYAFAFANLAVQGWLVIALLRRRHPDRFIVAVGVAAMILASAIQMAPDLLGIGRQFNSAYIYGFVVLLLAMAVHLARSVGRTHAELAGRIEEVQHLSEANLAEQARAQDAALERIALEAENKRQAERLAAAETRAALLDELTDTNRRLRQMQAQLVQSEKMASLGQLVAGVAHEMNTPIGAIHSVHDSLAKAVQRIRERLSALAPELAEDRKLSGALKVLDDSADVVARGSERVSGIVQRLRTFARLDEAALQRADLHEGLEDTLVLTRHELKHGIEVIRDFGELPPIACFPGQLNQVFLNLIINAKHAMGDKGVLTLRTRDLEDAVQVQVIDDGPGIAPEHLARVFDPGFTTKGVGVGTGLGLAICYRIVEAHHGQLSVDSEPGQGATFTLRLPKDLEARLGAAVDSARPRS